MSPARRRTSLATAALAATGLTSLGLAALPGGAQAATDTTPGYSLHHMTVNVKVGPAGDQSCVVDADLYQPDGASRTHKVPAILTTNGFGGAKDDSNQSAVGKGFATAGYVVLSYTGLGFPNSGCKIHLDDRDWDGIAGKRMVSVLAGKKTVTFAGSDRLRPIRYVAKEAPGDPRVGMIGGSYGGQIQYAVAALDDRVDALIPIITWNDLSYSLAPNNTDVERGVTYRTPGVYKREWTNLFFGVGLADGVQGSTVDPTRNKGCPNFARRACKAKAQLDATGFPDQSTLRFARQASVATYLDQISAPTLVVQGQADTLFNLQEAAATYTGLRRQGTPVRMVWQSWGHSESEPAPGELDLGADDIRDTYLGRRFLHWMDHYVRGDAGAPVGPRFSYFRDWVKYDTDPAAAGRAVARAYAVRDRYALGRGTELYLSGSDALVPSRDAAEPVHESYANSSAGPTSYSETSGLEGSNGCCAKPSDTPGTFAAFSTVPLARRATLVGMPRLTVTLDAPVAAGTQAGGPGGQLVLFAKLYDVAPDGSIELQHRLISPVRVGDVTEPVRIDLPGVVQRIPAGHTIRLVLAASDKAYDGNRIVQPVTVTGGRLTLPVTGDLALD
jgi:ABC-2 type transport system ATP-binding protein